MAFVKTTLTDESNGKITEFCFNTNFVMTMQPSRSTTILTFIDGQKIVVDTHYDSLNQFVGAVEKLPQPKQ
jgi:hypothetical protein